MSEDPWKHRSSGMKCNTCMWFVLKEQNPKFVVQKGADVGSVREVKPGKCIPVDEFNSPVQLSDSNIGRCRRHAPTMNGYPVVFKSDWCGDHRVDENKI